MSINTSLLAVFAHPDDEAFSSGGTLAHYAAQGAKVSLICATRGEAGKIKDPTLSIKDLGVHREGELRKACAALGIDAPIFLDYHDSGRNERLRKDDPQAFINADLLEVEEKIRQVIAAVEPEVMLTFDPHGAYGHPDHLVIHRAATAAFYSSGHLPKPPERLFYTAMPSARLRQIQGSGENIMAGLEPTLYGVSEGTIAVRMDIAAQRDKKRAALEAHGSQFSPANDPGMASMESMLEDMLKEETFALGGVRGALPHWPLQDFFDGLE